MASFKPPYLGAAYYPECWPLEFIDQDVALMKAAGMNVMRIGEFAWARMERHEGEYDFTWLHLVVEKLADAGIATIMCTPTCTPPVWLSERYPEILVMNDRAERAQHGARRQACANSPQYRAHCARIVTRMAREFGQDSRIIGWQIDNELYPPHLGCQCPVCHAGFQNALQARFGTIEALNEAWCLNLWSQAYESFAQIPLPHSRTWHHPSLWLAWSRFQSDSYVDFTRQQAEILHGLARQPVGTDMMPTNGLNYRDIHQHLDLVQFNHYNTMETLWQAAFWMDFCRPLKPHPFWNTETATCWNGGVNANGYREPGFCRANSWLPIALGAEANLYWLWRAHRAGHELMHGSVIDSFGRPLHIFQEVQEIAAGFKAAGGFLRDSRPEPAKIALHFSGHAWCLFDSQPMVNGFKYGEQIRHVYHPLMQAQLRMDVIDPATSLDPYRLVLSPFLPHLDEAGLAQRLKPWIEAGGTWIVGPLCDNRDEHGAKFYDRPFKYLEQWAGVRLRYGLPADPRRFHIRFADGECQGSIWHDAFEPCGAEVLATYTENELAGLAALTQMSMGKGQIVILGTLPEPPAFQRLLLQLAGNANAGPVASASDNLLVVPRRGPAGRGLVAVELAHRTGSLTLPEPATDLLTQQRCRGTIDIEPYGVRVMQY